MDTVDDVAALYDAALSLSWTAFAGQHYAVAYHGLAAAMHAAYDLGDDQRLVEVGEVSREQGIWLDSHDPGHELSAQSAAGRGAHSLWASLGHEVHTRRQMLEQRRLLDHLHPHACE